jgi:hypothetical protein
MSIFDEAHFAQMTDSHNVQLRVYIETVTNIIVTGGATGTGAVSINYCNLICRTTKMSNEVVQNRLALMTAQPEHLIYHDCRYGTFPVNSGVSASQLVLSSITGKVAFMFFTVRSVGSTAGDGGFTYNKIANFSILDSTSSNITSGVPITDALSLNYLSKYFTNSSYLSETATGSNANGVIVNNGANVYCYSFSSDPMNAITQGRLLSSKQFIGSEQLIINYTATLGTAAIVEVYCLTESILEVGAYSVTKMSA